MRASVASSMKSGRKMLGASRYCERLPRPRAERLIGQRRSTRRQFSADIISRRHFLIQAHARLIVAVIATTPVREQRHRKSAR